MSSTQKLAHLPITFSIIKGIAITLYLVGIYMNNELIMLTGIILFGHSSMDRIFGYGLKHNDRFNNTHLGIIGNNK